jgi:hypothetical protein
MYCNGSIEAAPGAAEQRDIGISQSSLTGTAKQIPIASGPGRAQAASNFP